MDFLLLALALSIAGSGFLWIRTRPPRRDMHATIANFRRELDALSPERSPDPVVRERLAQRAAGGPLGDGTVLAAHLQASAEAVEDSWDEGCDGEFDASDAVFPAGGTLHQARPSDDGAANYDQPNTYAAEASYDHPNIYSGEASYDHPNIYSGEASYDHRNTYGGATHNDHMSDVADASDHDSDRTSWRTVEIEHEATFRGGGESGKPADVAGDEGRHVAMHDDPAATDDHNSVAEVGYLDDLYRHSGEEG